MLPASFQKAIQIIKGLENNDRYIGAFVFGSAAREEVNNDSDLDVKVVLGETSPCNNINHPSIEGVKLDIKFLSLGKLRLEISEEERSGRIPMIAESIILFDKTGVLRGLKEEKRLLRPRKFSKSDYQNQQFFIYHANDKVERNLEKDPHSALLSMHAGVKELLKIHYEINGKWQVSSKRTLRDLDQWDSKLADFVRRFVEATDIKLKFAAWSAIIDHVTDQMGGRMKIEENVCNCRECKVDLANLQELAKAAQTHIPQITIQNQLQKSPQHPQAPGY